MDRNKCTYFIQLLVVFGGLVLVRSGIITGGYPGYPGYPVDPYRRYPPRHYPPRRPIIIDDTSAVSNQHTNVVNTNDNTNVNENSNNVVVNQSTGQRPRCPNACDVIRCHPYYEECVEDLNCTGGQCRERVMIGRRPHLGGAMF